jgi:hypothetical protein
MRRQRANLKSGAPIPDLSHAAEAKLCAYIAKRTLHQQFS